jgi:hypothetical protein
MSGYELTLSNWIEESGPDPALLNITRVLLYIFTLWLTDHKDHDDSFKVSALWLADLIGVATFFNARVTLDILTGTLRCAPVSSGRLLLTARLHNRMLAYQTKSTWF